MSSGDLMAYVLLHVTQDVKFGRTKTSYNLENQSELTFRFDKDSRERECRLVIMWADPLEDDSAITQSDKTTTPYRRLGMYTPSFLSRCQTTVDK